MTKKRFEVVMNEFDEIEYIMDKEMMEDRDFADFIDFVEDVCKENEWLKKELKRCKDWINSDKNDYELTLAFIKNKGYSLKDVLEYEKELKSE